MDMASIQNWPDPVLVHHKKVRDKQPVWAIATCNSKNNTQKYNKKKPAGNLHE